MAVWNVITTAHLDDYMAAAQASALRTAALGAGQTDPFGRVMPDIAAFIRQRIRSGGYSVSATANAIPPEMKWAGCYLILEALQTRIPGLSLTPEQKTKCEDAKRWIERIAAGTEEPSKPDDPESPPDVQSPTFTPRIIAPVREFTRANQDGL